MTNDKRFIDKKPFVMAYNEQEFTKTFHLDSLHWFDENGVIGECPTCSDCGRGYIDPKLPKGKDQYDLSRKRMQIALDKAIENEIEEEYLVNDDLDKLRSKIRELNFEIENIKEGIRQKIQTKYPSFIRSSEEECPTVS